jgi:hypothetical protein
MAVDASQQQPSTAHIPTTNKVCRESEPVAKDSGQHVDVLRSRDASEQDNSLSVDINSAMLRILLEGITVQGFSMHTTDAKVFNRLRSIDPVVP